MTSFLSNKSHISGDSNLFVVFVMSPWTFNIANLSAHAPSGIPYFFAVLSRCAGRSAPDTLFVPGGWVLFSPIACPVGLLPIFRVSVGCPFCLLLSLLTVCCLCPEEACCCGCPAEYCSLLFRSILLELLRSTLLALLDIPNPGLDGCTDGPGRICVLLVSGGKSK